MRKGTFQSEATRAKISESMKGRRKSPETREKMSIKRAIYWAKQRQAYRLQKKQQEELLNNVREPEHSSDTFTTSGEATT